MEVFVIAKKNKDGSAPNDGSIFDGRFFFSEIEAEGELNDFDISERNNYDVYVADMDVVAQVLLDARKECKQKTITKKVVKKATKKTAKKVAKKITKKVVKKATTRSKK